MSQGFKDIMSHMFEKMQNHQRQMHNLGLYK